MRFFYNQDHIVEIEGVIFKFSDEPPTKKGDMYIAERNIGPQLLTVAEIKDGYIIPKESAYCYNTSECRSVVEMV